ncbi:hypothetical protein BDW72DRAFT_168226 [Aspergillus terricola var. indicus]
MIMLQLLRRLSLWVPLHWSGLVMRSPSAAEMIVIKGCHEFIQKVFRRHGLQRHFVTYPLIFPRFVSYLILSSGSRIEGHGHIRSSC